MEEVKWTVARRRSVARTPRQRSKCRPDAAAAAAASLLKAEEGDEGLLLLRLKRSIARVQESAFFQRFLLQVQSSPVCDLLLKATSNSCSQNFTNVRMMMLLEHEKEHELPRDELVDEIAERFSRENLHGNQEVSLPLKSSSSAERAEDCSGASLLYASRTESCERSQESDASNAKDTSSITVECKSATDLGKCNCASGAECTCKTTALQVSTEHWHLDVVLYGLGSIADSEISRCQLALILLLKERLSWVGVIEVYDPVLSLSECKVIKELGCIPVALDEKGRRSVTMPTLFYMPHCEDWLYNNVLHANWVLHTLRQIVLLGNSFQDYRERWSSLFGRKSTPPSYVLQYQQIVKEVPVEATSSDLPGFNNMSWHFCELFSTS